ncbi:nuclear transport factor 2 family protein [Pseudomonas luteola]|uniref:nuclear transport factor 2 family protein n=1 Tax=Pseudomonas luteola TaxID=47886 RepID=UPI00123BACE6|nr:nuclear transport factor 2 family protein [Pseudomonas luteola]QEU26620.1 nuclear transport factor 2 family protein [Pseudomonas luteola]
MEIALEIKEAEEQLRQAMLASDVEALDRLLSSELIFTNHLGQCLGKEADLSAHRSGALSISCLEPSEQKIRLIGPDTAAVSVRVQIVGRYAGQPADGDFRFTRIWKRLSNAQWQVAVAHAGIIA